MQESIIVNSEIFKYINSLYPQPKLSNVFADMENRAKVEELPIVSKDVGIFLHTLVKLIKPQRILEIGCNIGYSAIWMASALSENAHLDTIELSKDVIPKAKKYFDMANLSDKISILFGAGINVIPNLNEIYDIVFIDAVKYEYKEYLNLSLPKLRQGGLVLVDNLLWKGKVISNEFDNKVKPIQDFNEYFISHPDLDSTILTIGDGLGFGVKK